MSLDQGNDSPVEFKDLSLSSKVILLTFTAGVVLITSIQILRTVLTLFLYFWRSLQRKITTKSNKQSTGKKKDVQEQPEGSTTKSDGSVDLPAELQYSPLFLSSLQGHLDKVASVSISLDAKHIATCCMDNVLRIYQLDSVNDQTPKFLRKKLQKPPIDVAFGRDFSQLAFVTAETKNESTLKFFDSSSGQVIKSQFNIHDSKACTKIASSATSPLGLPLLITCATRREIKIFDFSGKFYDIIYLDSYNDFSSLSISADGRFICATNNEKNVYIWEILVNNLKQYQGCQKFADLDKHNEGVLCCAFSPDSRRIATVANDGLRVWNLNMGNFNQNSSSNSQKNVKLVLKMPLPLKVGQCYKCLSWGQERVIIGSINGDIHFINAGNGRFEDCVRNVHCDCVNQIKVSQMVTEQFGRILVTCGQDNQVPIFRVPQIE